VLESCEVAGGTQTVIHQHMPIDVGTFITMQTMSSTTSHNAVHYVADCHQAMKVATSADTLVFSCPAMGWGVQYTIAQVKQQQAFLAGP
jgi:hypothetical protein